MSSRKSSFSFRYSDTVFADPTHAHLYSQFRQTLPQKVLDYILDYLSCGIDRTDWDIAVDVGCGGGQSTQVLAKHFTNVYGFDVSEAMVNEAIESDHPNNVHFEVSRAEKLTKIKRSSVQLVTACMAVQWFNLSEFFDEAKRILSHKGILALVGHTMFEPIDPDDPGDTTLTELIMSLRDDPALAPYKLPNTRYNDTRYRSIWLPDNFEYHYRDNLVTPVSMTAADIVGFVQTWSPYQQMFKSSQSEAKMFLKEFRHKLEKILKTDNLSEKQLLCNYRYYVVIGRNK